MAIHLATAQFRLAYFLGLCNNEGEEEEDEDNGSPLKKMKTSY